MATTPTGAMEAERGALARDSYKYDPLVKRPGA
jgi:hypothetical protein